MSLNIQYGPISTAMGLAQTAGRGEGRRQDFAGDLDLLNYMQRAQSMANQQKATEISQSLQGQGLGLEAQHNQATQNLAQQQLSANTQYRQGRNDISQQNADTRSQQVENQGDSYQQRAAIQQQNADTNAQYRTGLLPIQQQNADARTQGVQNRADNAQGANAARQETADTGALQAEVSNLQKFVDSYDRNFKQPDADYSAAKARLATIQQGMQGRNQPLLGQPVHVQAPQAGQGGRGMGGPPQQQQQPGSNPANPVQVHTAAQYAALPPGTYYVDSTGVLAQKH